MLQATDQNYHVSAPKTIKLSAGLRSQPVARTLKSNLVLYKDSISHTKTNELPNRSVQLQRKQSNQEHSNHKWDKVTVQNKQINLNLNRELQNPRFQSLLANSRDIKRVSTELDQNINRSKQKSLNYSQIVSDYKSPVLKKDQSQYTRTSQNIHSHTQQFNSQERSSYQKQIQDLMNKVQYLQNECRNLRNQNQQLQRSMSAPKQLLQRELEDKTFRIEDLQKRLNAKNRQHLDKCVQNQKNFARITELQGVIKKGQNDKQKSLKELEKANQYGVQIFKQLSESIGATQKVEQQKKKVQLELQGEKQKYVNLAQQKKLLQLEFSKISKLKDLVKEMQQSDNDKAQVIKRHIAYEAQLIDINGVILSNLQTHKHDLKINSQQQQMINKQIDTITNQIAVKIKDVLEQKQKVQDELTEARAQTERIRKTMFSGYQDIISNLKDQMIKLKQENINLSNDSQSKITIVKLEREIKMLQTKSEDLMKRNKQMQQIIQKLNEEHKKTLSEISTQTSIRAPEYFDRTGAGANFQSIIMSYQTRGLDLNERIHQKQINQIQLKRRVQQLEGQIQDLKGQAQLSTRKQRCDNDNIKLKIQSMKMQLKAQTDSLSRKIETLQKNIQRKNKEIKQKDNFITHYLIQKVKGQSQVNQIIQEIDRFFQEAN